MPEAEAWVAALSNGHAILTALLAGLLAGIAVVFVRKERRRSERSTRVLKVVRKANFAGDSRRARRRVKQERPRQSAACRCISKTYALSIAVLDVCTTKALDCLQGCPPSVESEMERGLSSGSSDEELLGSAHTRVDTRARKEMLQTKSKPKPPKGKSRPKSLDSSTASKPKSKLDKRRNDCKRTTSGSANSAVSMSESSNSTAATTSSSSITTSSTTTSRGESSTRTTMKRCPHARGNENKNEHSINPSNPVSGSSTPALTKPERRVTKNRIAPIIEPPSAETTGVSNDRSNIGNFNRSMLHGRNVSGRTQVNAGSSKRSRPSSQIPSPSGGEKKLLERMGWNPEDQNDEPLSELEIQAWKAKWSDWNAAKRSTIRKVIGLPSNAGLGAVIEKLVKLESKNDVR